MNPRAEPEALSVMPLLLKRALDGITESVLEFPSHLRFQLFGELLLALLTVTLDCGYDFLRKRLLEVGAHRLLKMIG